MNGLIQTTTRVQSRSPAGATEALEQLKALFAIEEDIRKLKLAARTSNCID